MRQPGFEPGFAPWQGAVLPLDYWRKWAGWESNPGPPPRQGGIIATRPPAQGII